ncbi:MAG: neutral/alkaline non-lysosomal ceramidase N-terminal domain-containing protein [Planctomycetes bacterium]|nr:neutral/alkaline non-lysosomal ceramidase N-terminal domain-containing protein [Planctomycetota bacterium]
MRIGTSQVDIAPAVGSELSGFAARTQPSIGVLDPLYARALYLEDGDERLLWVHCDVIGFRREFVEAFRGWATDSLGLPPGRVMLSATHTHAGPATVVLHEAGEYDRRYVAWLDGRLREAAMAAAARTEACQLVAVEGRCDLAVDRRGRATAHTDPRVAAGGWRRDDGTYIAVLVNYPMHPVALGPVNRHISADWPGRTAAALTRDLPGGPMVLVASGGCGNLNSPEENVSVDQVDDWGGQVASAVIDHLREASSLANPLLRVCSRTVRLPMEALTPAQIDAYAERSLQNVAGLSEWGDKFRRAIGVWRHNMTEAVKKQAGLDTAEAELFGVRLGNTVTIGINAEVFSVLADDLRRRTGTSVYVVGYANGVIGYLPTTAAFDEGGYEVEMAHLFYDSFRPRRGALDFLADHAAKVVGDLMTAS